MIPTTRPELDEIRDACLKMVNTRASVSAAASAIPTLGLDVLADSAILLELIPAINRQFGLSPDQIAGYDPTLKIMLHKLIKKAGVAMIGVEVTKSILTPIFKKIAARTMSRQVLKFVPVLGWAANAAIGFAAMRYVGNVHVKDCYAVCLRILEDKESTLRTVEAVSPLDHSDRPV